MGDHDRDAILRRRALLVSAALAGLACTTHETPAEPKAETPTTEEPPAVVVETPGEGPSSPTPSDGARPSWSEVMAKAPPVDVPTGLTPREAEMLGYVTDNAKRRYEQLEKIWTTLPSCGPSQDGCEGWAEAVEVLRDINPEDYGPLCGYSAETTHTYLERGRAHDRYVRQISDMLTTDLDAAIVARGNPADTKAWEAANRPQAMGRPCLSCAMPTAEPVIEAIEFGADDATLGQGQDSKLEAVRSIHEMNRQQSKAKLIIRGHADSSEKDPEGLGRLRAEAVAGALTGLGINRKHIEVRSYGATLRITNDPNAAANRRVDFEVVVP